MTAKKRHLRSSERLEKAREKYRVVRAKLIEAVMADKVDVVSPTEVNAAKKAFELWLKHVDLMGKYWSKSGNDFAKFLGRVPIAKL